MSNEGKDRVDGLEPGDDGALWQLLGRARTPEAGPYFSRRVLREVARLEDDAGTAADVAGGGSVGRWLARWLRQAWRRPGAAVWPGAVAAAVFWLSVELTIPSSVPGGASRFGWPRDVLPSADAAAGTADPAAKADGGGDDASAAVAEDNDAPQDMEVIADLDNVITREENRLWTEDTARF